MTATTPVVLSLRGIPWQWDFTGPADVSISRTSPYPGQNTVVLRSGETYEIHVYDDAYQEDHPHYFSGVAAIGLPGTVVRTGAPEGVFLFRPMTSGDFPFRCQDVCGLSARHDAMQGLIRVVP